MFSHGFKYIIVILCSFLFLPLFAESIAVGSQPVHAVVYDKRIYVVNSDTNTVSVIDTTKKEVKATIPVGIKPLSATVVGKSVYIGNSEGSTITIVDTQKDEVYKTISIPKGLVNIFSSGNYIYAIGNEHITVVDATKNTILRTITTKGTVGSSFPTFFTANNRIFVHHPGDVYLTMINGNNGAATFINMGYGTTSGVIIGNKLYTVNSQLDQIHVLDAYNPEKPILINGVPIVIPAGKNPTQSIAIGTKIYVNNIGDNTVSVIDTTKNSILKTIQVGLKPTFMVLSGRVLFVMNNEGNSISVIDTSTDDVVKTMSVGITPVFGVIDTGFLYSLDSKSNSVSTFNVKIPQLLEINTTAAAGKYTQNNSLTIKATFDIEPIPGSSMRLTLNTNRVILLDTVDGKSLTGIYTVGVGENTPKLSVKSIDFANIKNNSDIPGVSYGIPEKKNIDDLKAVSVGTTSTSAPITSSVCKKSGMYRTCPLSKAPENSTQYRENMICEGFISEKQPQGKKISRIEVLNIAVNMLHGPKSAATEYDNTYTDITLQGNSQETVSVIQTGLVNNLIYPNNGAFEPTKQISRIEAYALLMRGVCMQPEESSDIARAIHQKALQNAITTKQWARFRAYSSITRNEVYILASQLADWADKNGGCDALQCRK